MHWASKLVRQRGGRRRVEDRHAPTGARLGEGVGDDVDGDLQLAEHDPGVGQGSGGAAAALAPAMTMIEFSPAASTVISARPVAVPASRCTAPASMPSPASTAASRVAGGVVAERRHERRSVRRRGRAATTWLSPLPPGYSW